MASLCEAKATTPDVLRNFVADVAKLWGVIGALRTNEGK